MRCFFVAFLALPVLYSCGDAGGADAVTVVDSAGITIVTNSSDQISAAPHWSLVQDSVLTLGLQAEDSPVFYRITDLLPLSDGRVAVLNAGTSEVLILDETGVLVERLGGAGDGPGEFREPTSLVLLPPDSIAVYDSSPDRLSVFDRHGVLERVASIEDVPQTSGFEKMFGLRDGHLVLFTWGGFSTEEKQGVFRAEAECLRVSPTGEKTGSYGVFPGTQVFIGNGAMGSPLFSADTHVATSGDQLIVGTAEEPEWRVYDLEGALSKIVRWPDRDRTVTQDRVEALVGVIASQLPQEQQAQARSFLSGLPQAPRVPAYQGILASDEGEVWVGDYPDPTAAFLELPPPARRWMVFGESGEIKATLETPTGFQPLALAIDAVFGVFRDELGVETPRKYQVVRE